MRDIEAELHVRVHEFERPGQIIGLSPLQRLFRRLRCDGFRFPLREALLGVADQVLTLVPELLDRGHLDGLGVLQRVLAPATLHQRADRRSAAGLAQIDVRRAYEVSGIVLDETLVDPENVGVHRASLQSSPPSLPGSRKDIGVRSLGRRIKGPRRDAKTIARRGTHWRCSTSDRQACVAEGLRSAVAVHWPVKDPPTRVRHGCTSVVGTVEFEERAHFGDIAAW